MDNQNNNNHNNNSKSRKKNLSAFIFINENDSKPANPDSKTPKCVFLKCSLFTMLCQFQGYILQVIQLYTEYVCYY